MNRTAFMRSLAMFVAGGMAVANAIAGEAVSVAPVVSLSFRGVGDGVIEQGEPLSVAVRLAVPDRSAATIELAPASGTWVGAVSVEITKTSDASVLARAEPVGQPDSLRIALDARRAAGGLWMFRGAAMHLPPGDYFVRVRLVIDAGAGWRGQARSSNWPMKIVAVSTAPERVSQRTLAKAAEAAARKNLQGSAAILDAQLKLTPGDRPMLLLRAALAEQTGNFAAALLCANLAARGLPGNSPPPAGLSEMQARLRAKMLSVPAAGMTAVPPAWTWPPAEIGPARSEIGTKGNLRPTGVPASPVSSSPALPPPAQPVVANPRSPAGPKIGAPSSGVVVPAAELDDKKIRADAAGQWAATGIAGSFQKNPYNYYTPARATGEPNVAYAGYNTEAWCPAQQNTGEDWLELAFAKPTRATVVRVRQTFNPGAIIKVEAVEADGTTHLWWQGSDPYQRPATREIAWFAVSVPPTSYPVARIKLTLNLAAGPGYKQVDAVQLVAAP